MYKHARAGVYNPHLPKLYGLRARGKWGVEKAKQRTQHNLEKALKMGIWTEGMERAYRWALTSYKHQEELERREKEKQEVAARRLQVLLLRKLSRAKRKSKPRRHKRLRLSAFDMGRRNHPDESL